jgi:outer membrane protein assembly factor BamD
MLFSDRSIRARQPERLGKVLEIYERLSQIFPDSPILSEARRLYDEAVQKQSDLAASL